MQRHAVALTAALWTVLWLATPAFGAATAKRLTAATTVTVQLTEWKVVPSAPSARSGSVTFVARNVGKFPHNLVVLRTNLAPGKLPVAGSRAKEIGRVGKTPDFGPGQTRRLTLTLRAGRYLLICNVPGHYRAGMTVAFRVR